MLYKVYESSGIGETISIRIDSSGFWWLGVDSEEWPMNECVIAGGLCEIIEYLGT